MIKELQRNAAFRNPNMAAALLSASAVKDNKLHCSGCENAYERENTEQFGDAEAKSKEESSFRWSACSGEETLDTVVYTCPQCGGEITGDQVTAATRCPYCDNNVVMSSQVSGILKPDLIIPFKTTKEQAIEALKNFYKKKKLLPDAFKSENRIKEIKGIKDAALRLEPPKSANKVLDVSIINETANLLGSDIRVRYTDGEEIKEATVKLNDATGMFTGDFFGTALTEYGFFNYYLNDIYNPHSDGILEINNEYFLETKAKLISGDVNGDRDVDIRDIVRLKKHFAENADI